MSDDDTIGKYLALAKEILARGKPSSEGLPPGIKATGGTIDDGDIYAAYKLLERFVDEVESYQLLLAVMGVDNYKQGVLKWKATLDRAEGR